MSRRLIEILVCYIQVIIHGSESFENAGWLLNNMQPDMIIHRAHTRVKPEHSNLDCEILNPHKKACLVYNHHHHHHHHIVLAARISLTLFRHSSLSFIALGRSSGQQPVSSHSCWMYVRAGRPAFARPCVGIHKSTSLMSSSLLLQQCPACLVRLTWIVFVIGGRWPYSWCLVGCCRQDLLRIARSILV